MTGVLAKVPQPHPEVAARVIEGEAVILTMHDKTLRVLNKVGTRIWDLVDGKRTGEEILRCMVEEYDVDGARARADVETFLGELAAVGIVVLADQPVTDRAAGIGGGEGT